MLRHALVTCFLPLVLILPITAQPDALRDCRRQASVATNAPMSEINARRDQELDNGNSLIRWDARMGKGHNLSGVCEADARTGRIIRFREQSGGRRQQPARNEVPQTDAA